MNCLLLLCLSGLYIEGGIGYVDLPSSNIQTYSFAQVNKPPLVLVSGARMHDYNTTANPMGRVALGHEWNPSPHARISLELRHESWVGTGKDYGTNSAWASVRVLPWSK